MHKFKLELTLDQVGLIMDLLGQAPFRVVFTTVEAIKAQMAAQGVGANGDGPAKPAD